MGASGFTWIMGAMAAALVLLLMGGAIYAAWLRYGVPRDDDGVAA